MGSEQSKNSTDITINNPKFKSVKMVTLDSNRVMEDYMGGVEKKQYQKWTEDLDKINFKNDQFLLLPLKHKFSSEGLCSSNGLATINYPNFPRVLSDEIDDRRGKKQQFDEDQYWYLLYALAQAKINSRPFEKIGDVRPENVFINDQGLIKVANMLSWPGARTNFQKAFEHQPSYLAPEEVQKLGTISHQENGDAEMFSIGLTLLSLSAQEDLTYLYDTKLHAFDSVRLSQKLNEFKVNTSHSQILRSTVSNLCDANPQKRMNCDELWKIVEKKEDQIKNRQVLHIDNAPQKLHEEVGELRRAMPILLKTMQSIQTPQQNFFTRSEYEPISRQTLPNATQAQSVYIPRPK